MANVKPLGYSATQIVLHWIIAALVLVQELARYGIKAAWEAIEKGEAATAGGLMANVHVVLGIAILVLALWRVGLRLTRGAPAVPVAEHPALRMLARAVHVLLYALIFVLPISGAVAWFLRVERAAELHAALQWLILPVVALHIVGALAHQFVFRTGLMRRMLVPKAR